MKYVFVDLDHTLFHSAWRDHLSPTKNLDGMGTREEDWDRYSLAGSHDDPVEEVRLLLDALSRSGHVLVVLTATHERFRALTNQRLLDSRTLHYFSEILMRPAEYHGMPTPILKTGLILDFLKKKDALPARDNVLFVLEDRPDVIEAIKPLGVTCLQVHAVRRDDDRIFCKECDNRTRCRNTGMCDISGADL